MDSIAEKYNLLVSQLRELIDTDDDFLPVLSNAPDISPPVFLHIRGERAKDKSGHIPDGAAQHIILRLIVSVKRAA